VKPKLTTYISQIRLSEYFMDVPNQLLQDTFFTDKADGASRVKSTFIQRQTSDLVHLHFHFPKNFHTVKQHRYLTSDHPIKCSVSTSKNWANTEAFLIFSNTNIVVKFPVPRYMINAIEKVYLKNEEPKIDHIYNHCRTID